MKKQSAFCQGETVAQTRREILKAAGFTGVCVGAGLWPGLSSAQAGGFAPHRYVFALRGDGAVAVIDPAQDKVVRSIGTGGAGGTLASLSRDLKKLYVANNAAGQRMVTVIDTEALTVLRQIETGNRPKHPVVSPDGKLIAVNHSGLDAGKLRISFLSTQTDELVRQIELPVANTSHTGDFSMHGAWSPDGALFAIGSYADNRVAFIRVSDFRVFEFAAPGNPHYFDWRGRNAWVMVEFNKPRNTGSLPQVMIVDASNPESLKLVAQFAMSRQDHDTPNETFVEGHHGSFTNDGRRYITLNRGSAPGLPGVTVDVYDTSTRARLASMDAGVSGVGHAYCTPDGRYALITQYNSRVLPVLDLQSLRIVARIDAGKGGHLGHAAFTADGRKVYVNNRMADEVLVIDTGSWTIVNRIQTAASGQAQAMVLNAYYNVFERVVSPLLAA
jgi:DNA-binding beta-propeller fold protein YncE